ncbi:MAG: TolC family outer membrane protein [Saccharospirillaceae bacterium]|nr:TolC family outer membrane protein [Pseudomonadales bacterium]NRB78272.1 TolC family outer membrane protein [Saccharospirillaceae bacterium]
MFKKLTLTACVALGAFPAFAQEDLLSVYNQALENNPALKMAVIQNELNQLGVKSAFGNLMPSVSGSISYGVGGNSDNNSNADIGLNDFDFNFNEGQLDYSITVNQAIYNKAAIDGYAAVKINASKSEVDLSISRQNLLMQVSTQYITVLKSYDSWKTAKSGLNASSRQKEQVEKRYEVGLVAITDVQAARANYDSMRVSVIRSKARYEQSLLSLSNIAGEKFKDIKSLNDQFMPAVESKPLNVWVESAVVHSLDIQKSKLEVEQQRKTLDARKALLLPSLGGSLSYTYTDRFDDHSVEGNSSSAQLGLRLSIPIYNGGMARTDIKTEELKLSLFEQQLMQTTINIRANIENVYRQIEADFENIEAQLLAIESSNGALKATQVGYEQGSRTIVELLNAQSNLLNAQLTLSNAKYDLVINQFTLRQSAGVLSLNDIELLNQSLIK